VANEAITRGEIARQGIAICLALFAGSLAIFFFVSDGIPSVSARFREKLEFQHQVEQRLDGGDATAISSVVEKLKTDPKCQLWRDLCSRRVELPAGLPAGDYAAWLIENEGRLTFDDQKKRFCIPR
jgi:hypothetical protein